MSLGAYNIYLRISSKSDSEFAFQVKKAAIFEYVEMRFGWDEKKQRKIHERRFGTQRFRIIVAGDEDVGIISTETEPDCVRVDQLYLLPERQSRGIGTAVLRLISQEADKNYVPTRLRCRQSNLRALEFYKRSSFVSTGKTDTHFLLERSCSR